MLGPKTDNSVTGSKDVTQIGHNFGTINTGLTFEQHEENVQRRLGELRADLERAHGAERALLQREFDAVQGKMANLQADYQANLVELADLKQTLAQYHNQIDADARRLADTALDNGDRSLARALLTELSAKAQARHADAAEEAASLEFKLGEMAENEVRWADAAAHYARAASLHPTLEAFYKATYFTQLAGNYPLAQRLAQEFLEMARLGGDSAFLSLALSTAAEVYRLLTNFPASETHFREALSIILQELGPNDLSYATALSNLANAVQSQLRYSEAESLYRQAIEIDRKTTGEGHPEFSTRMNNLAIVVKKQKRFHEAIQLFEKAIEIDSMMIGERHPKYAIRLGNLGQLLGEIGRKDEARPMLQQSLDIFRAALPADHPYIGEAARRLADLAPPKPLSLTPRLLYPTAKIGGGNDTCAGI